MEISERKNCW